MKKIKEQRPFFVKKRAKTEFQQKSNIKNDIFQEQKLLKIYIQRKKREEKILLNIGQRNRKRQYSLVDKRSEI